MFPFNRRVVPVFLVKIGLTLFALAAALTLAPEASANPGDLYATDLASNSIVVYRPDGTSYTFGGGFTLDMPQGLTFDQAGNLSTWPMAAAGMYTNIPPMD